jgi:hypothetical protein
VLPVSVEPGSDGVAEALEALTSARDTRQRSSTAHALVVPARLEACRGDEQACRRHLDEASGDPHAADDLSTFPREAARGLLDLNLGRAEQAILPLQRLLLAEDRQGLHEPAMFGWFPDLVEVFVKTGRAAVATDLVARFDTDAPPTTWTAAVAARCRGLLPAARRSSRSSPMRWTGMEPLCRSNGPGPSWRWASGSGVRAVGPRHCQCWTAPPPRSAGSAPAPGPSGPWRSWRSPAASGDPTPWPADRSTGARRFPPVATLDPWPAVPANAITAPSTCRSTSPG